MAENSISLSRALLVTELSKPNATPSSVAERLGCTASAITQALAADPALQQQVLAAKLVSAKAGLALDEQYDRIEKMALDQMEKVLPYVSDPMKLSRIAQVVNAAKRRAGPQAPSNGTDKVVSVQLPQAIKSRLQLSAQNEVTQIGERVLVTMPAAQLAAQLKEAQATEARQKVAAAIKGSDFKMADVL